jgi:hypothetical protein
MMVNNWRGSRQRAGEHVMRRNLGSAATAIAAWWLLLVVPLANCAANAATAAGPTPPDLKAEIDDVIHRMEGASIGVLKWDGAEHIDIRHDGSASVAEIVNAHIKITPLPRPSPAATATAETGGILTLDHIEIRQTPDADGSSFDLAVTFPRQAVFRGAGGAEIDIALNDGKLQAVLDAASGRTGSLTFSVTDGRIDLKESGDWIKFGPASGGYKITGAADGGWSGPSNFEMKGLEFFLLQWPISGSIDRITADGRYAGPDLAAAYRLRDRLTALQQKDKDLPPAERGRAILALLPDFLAQYSLAEGNIAIEGLTVRTKEAAPLVSLAHAGYGYSLKGASGGTAALRFTYEHDGLILGSSIPNANWLPRRLKLDLGVKNVDTAALRGMLSAAQRAQQAATPADRQLAGAQIIGAAATLNPELDLYHLTYDAPDFGLKASAVATGSPVSPKGYRADGDVDVRGFDAAARLAAGKPIARYLTELKAFGTPATAPDGSPRLDFHVASAPPKWLTINGHDVTGWFAGGGRQGAMAPAGEARVLRPTVPPMEGGDVRAVQYALNRFGFGVMQTGAYDDDTAAAVRRFQKENGLNVDGVVDAATRRKLGLGP